MQNWFTRAIDRWSEADRISREVARLSAMPAYLLRDMGLSSESRDALAQQLRRGK